MTTHNANNERIKRQYFGYLKEAMGHSEATVDAVAKSLARFEEDTKFRDFKNFHFQQASAFKRRLAEQTNQQTGAKLSKATLHSTLAQLRVFFHWLAGQPGYRSRFQYSDANYFNLSEKDVRVATAKREQTGPTLEQVTHVINAMPFVTQIERRNRALIAFTLLTGARDSAIASMKLKHVDLVARCVHQDAREVQTKFSKSFISYFFPVGDEVTLIFEQWVTYLKEELLWNNDDPLFPATLVAVGESRQFEAVGLAREHWSTATAIRGIFRVAFEKAGVRYFNPHSFRNTLVRLGEERCQTAEQFKAWSQNLGHDKVLTTFLSYGQVQTPRQGEILRGLASPAKPITQEFDAIADAVVRRLNRANIGSISQ